MMAPESIGTPDLGPQERIIASRDAAPLAQDGVAVGRAPLKWPHTKRRARPPSPSTHSDEDSEDEASDSDSEVEGSRVHLQSQRGHVDTSIIDGSSTSPSSSQVGSGCSLRVAEEPAGEADAPVPAIARSQLAERAATMFVVGSPAPVEVRKPFLAPKVTKGLVELALEVANELCDRDGKALSQSFGNYVNGS